MVTKKKDFNKLIKKRFDPLVKRYVVVGKVNWQQTFWKAVEWLSKLYTPKLESRDRDIIEMRIFLGVRKKLDEMKQNGKKMNVTEASINYSKSDDFKKLKKEYKDKAKAEDNIKGYKPYREVNIKVGGTKGGWKTIKKIFYKVDKETRTGIGQLIKKQASRNHEYY